MRSKVTVFEGGRVEIPHDGGARGRDRLLSMMVGGRHAFTLRNGTVFATHFVGACDAGSVRVEVLPKPYGISTVEQARRLMFDLLRWTGSGLNFTWLAGGSSKRDADLLELVERRAAQELLQHLELGPPRRYSEIRESSSVLRGRMIFSQYARQLPSDAHILPVSYATLAADNVLGRLLKAMATCIRDRAQTHGSRRDLDRCIDLLSNVRNVPLTLDLVAQVKLGRMETQWSGLIELAGLLAAQNSSDPASIGHTSQSTLMFPMNRLFEATIRRVLAFSMTGQFGCALTPGEHRLMSSLGEDGIAVQALCIRPDLLFISEGSIAAPGDAKWKRLLDSPPLYSMLPADAYQLLTYMRRFNVETGLMFFPRMEWMPTDWKIGFYVDPNRTEKIVVLSVDLAELVGGNEQSRQEAGKRLASRVEDVLGESRVVLAGRIAESLSTAGKPTLQVAH